MMADDAVPEKRTRFTHLELHSYYTMLGATPPIRELVARAKSGGLDYLALTDTNVLYGVVAFHKKCLEAEIQPILGVTLSTQAPPDIGARLIRHPGNLVLLASGPTGYRSLCRLSSIIQGKPHREALAVRGIDWDTLADNADGLLCLSGGRRGWLERLVRGGDHEGAARYAARLGGLFGENAYLGMEIHASDDRDIAQEIELLGRRFGLETVAVQPIYYLEPAEAPKLQLLRAIDENLPLEEVQESAPARFEWRDLHWLGAEEMAARFDNFPDALKRTVKIASQCRPALPDGRPIWPVLKLPQDESPEKALAELAGEGLRLNFGPQVPENVSSRLEKELAAIGRTGFTPLFLIVADIVHFARQADVPVSTRGSVANSLVAYCAGITTVDPIAHDLLFERFLNPARSSPPDIDLDFCSRRRDEVLAYVRQTYGQDRVALVATISTLRPKSAVRETGKALGLEEDEIGRLVKSLPRDWHPDPRRRGRRTVEEMLAEIDDPRLERVVTAAYDLVGQPHHLSVHPGGVVITPGPLTDYVPLQWAPKGFLITQFDHQHLETIGLPKLDLLGISALTVMADAAELVRKHHHPDFRVNEIPLDDQSTGDLLTRGETIGVFQCESAGAQRTLRQLKATTVSDLAVANAFFKPGPATGGMAQTFIRRYRGEERVGYLHPALEPILSTTKGVLLFQEQILRVATEIAGLSWEQADRLRRGMSKFRADEMEALQSQFLTGCTRQAPDGPGFTGQQAQTLWEQVMAFAGYGFNKGHATAYADVSYRSAFLKVHHPAAFFCARLADWGGFHHPAVYTAEAIRLGITIRPPHINHSNRAFTLTYGLPPLTTQGQRSWTGQHPVSQGQRSWAGQRPKFNAVELTRNQHPVASNQRPVLWMGLGQVRNLRKKTINRIIDERSKRPFDGLDDLLERIPLQAKEIIHLVQCGALDGLGPSRAAMLASAEDVRRAGSTRQMAFTFAGDSEVPVETPAERLAWERAILGRPVSVHPLDLLEQRPAEAIPLRDLPDTRGHLVTVVGVRLPGWTGGPGFFLADQEAYVVARGHESLKPPEPWIPLMIRGRWRSDEWGTQWLQVEEMTFISEI